LHNRLRLSNAPTWRRILRRFPACRKAAANTSCHGPGGYRIGAPALTKQNELCIDQQLHAFAQGTRGNDMNLPMRTIAAMLTESEMHALARACANEGTKEPQEERSVVPAHLDTEQR
jgi:cytochrome c553